MSSRSSQYFFTNGFRCVYPYHFELIAYAKSRWIGKPVLQAFTKEFPFIPAEYWIGKQTSGELKINGKPLDKIDTVIKSNDFITHNFHYHEKPVTDKPIGIIENNDDILVINKPSTIPIYPCGQYRLNSMVELLKTEEYSFNDLRPIHRLDRLTSGIVLIPKKQSLAVTMSKNLQDGKFKKEYVARVSGQFPPHEIDLDAPIVAALNPRDFASVGPLGKPSRTIFNLIKYDKATNTSVISCKPLTGRTHQIRIHLKHIGFPIANDPLYNEDFRAARYENKLTHPERSNVAREGAIHISNHQREHLDHSCLRCQEEFMHPQHEELWLHARAYSGEDFHYETKFPEWSLVQ